MMTFGANVTPEKKSITFVTLALELTCRRLKTMVTLETKVEQSAAAPAAKRESNPWLFDAIVKRENELVKKQTLWYSGKNSLVLSTWVV